MSTLHGLKRRKGRKELAEEKERKKEERKCKREEKEEANRRKKAAREEARKKKAVEKEEVKKRKEVEKEKTRKLKKGSGQPAALTQKKPITCPRLELLAANSDSSSDSASSSGEQESSSEPCFSCPKRQRQLPARFRNDSDTICHAREPTCTAKTVYCEMCGAWVHSYCAFKYKCFKLIHL